MDNVAWLIGQANTHFQGELIAYEATRAGHRVVFQFSDVQTFNGWWKAADYVKRTYSGDLVVEHMVPFQKEDPTTRLLKDILRAIYVGEEECECHN